MSALDDQQTDGLTAFSSNRPLLLLTDFSPDAQGGGAVILRSLLTAEDRRRIVWVTLSQYDPRTTDTVVSLALRQRRSLLRDATVRTSALRKDVKQIMAARGAPAAWIVAHGASVHVARGAIENGIPLHVTVHDDPAWALLTLRSTLLVPLLTRDLRHLLRRARSLDVVSRPMADRYSRFHDGDLTIVHRGLGDSVAPAPDYDRDELSVAVLGSTYGLGELKVAGAALERAGHQLGVPVRLTVIGGGDPVRVRRALPSGIAVEITGHLGEEAGIARLREAFLLYLSYPFSRRGEVLRTTSFPTKLSTYVMAARPILMHMPSDSSVAFLRATAPYATLWNSSAPHQGAEIIARLWRQDGTRQSFHLAADEVRVQHFSLSANRRNLLGALNALGS